MLHICGGLVLVGCQVPTKTALWLPSSAGQGRENINKGSWFEIRVGSDLAPLLLSGQGIHAHAPSGMAGKAAPAHALSLVFAEDLYQEYGDGVVLQKW